MYEDEYIDIGILFVDFLKGLKKFKLKILIFSLICTAGFYLYKEKTYVPMYNAQTVFTVKTVGNGSLNEVSSSYNFYYDKQTANQIGTTFPYIISSNLFKKELKNELGVEYINGSITSNVVADSNLVTISVKSANKEDALKILNGVVTVYPDISRHVIGKVELEIIESPAVGNNPYNAPNKKVIICQGFLVGFGISLGFVFLYALFRKTVRTKNDLNKLVNINCLSVLPEIRGNQKKYNVLNNRMDKRFVESINSLQNKIEFMMKEQEDKVLLITSTEPAEGKTTISLNLATAIAQDGLKVILVDGDFRKPDLAKRMNINDDTAQEKEVFHVDGIKMPLYRLNEENIYFVGLEKSIKNSIDVINSEDMAKAMNRMRELADVVIIDSPPSGMLADSAHMYKYADKVLYIIRQDWAETGKIIDAISGLPESGSKILGCVLNMVKTGIESYGYGYSGYGYGKYKYYNKKD